MHRTYWVIGLTLFVGFVLSIMPLPSWASDYRPDWVSLILIYWLIAVPERIGIGWSWLVGIIADLLSGSLLGTHGLVFVLFASACLYGHKMIRIFPIWQQAVFVFLLLLVKGLIVFWLLGDLVRTTIASDYWLSLLISTLLWPWVFVLLRDLRRRYG